jgi:predicted glycosyltransferase
MNREAAALGVPAYSIFKGKTAAVDRHLAATGRLVLLESPQDIGRIRLVRREPVSNPKFSEQLALQRIVENIRSVLAASCSLVTGAATRRA